MGHARRSAPAFTIYAGYDNSVVTWTSIAGVRFHLQSTRLLQCSSVWATSINRRSFATSAERRCSGHFSRSCPSGAEEAALVASCSAYPVGYKVALLMFMVHDNRCLVYKRIRLTSQQQLSTSTSSFCQQPRLHCSTDMNYQ